MFRALGAAALTFGLAGQLAAAGGVTPDLAGRWVIDHSLSDDERGHPAAGGKLPGIGGAPPGASPGEGPPAGGSPAGPRPAKAGGDPQAAMREFASTPENLIFGRDPDGTLTLDNGETLGRLYTDGRRFKRANGLLECKAHLTEGALVLESQPTGGGAKLNVSYSLDPKGRLVVSSTLKAPAGGKPIERLRFYTRTEEKPN